MLGQEGRSVQAPFCSPHEQHSRHKHTPENTYKPNMGPSVSENSKNLSSPGARSRASGKQRNKGVWGNPAFLASWHCSEVPGSFCLWINFVCSGSLQPEVCVWRGVHLLPSVSMWAKHQNHKVNQCWRNPFLLVLLWAASAVLHIRDPYPVRVRINIKGKDSCRYWSPNPIIR